MSGIREGAYRLGLMVIASQGCQRYTHGVDCWKYGTNAVDAKYTADRACDPCIAQRVLELGHLPSAAEVGVEPR